MKKTEVLIAGGTGFIGFHLANSCLAKGMNVTSISTKYPQKNRKLKKVKYLICDLFNKKKLKKIIKKNYNFVVNLGGYVDHSNRKKTYDSHYIGCKNLSNIFLKKKLLILYKLVHQVNMVSLHHHIMKNNYLFLSLFMENRNTLRQNTC